MGILIGGDFVPTKSNEHYFKEKKDTILLGEDLCKLLKNADYRIFNLETPLTSSTNRIDKCGPNLKTGEETAKLFSKINVDIFTLANNHIMDYGVEGMKATLNTLNELGIGHLGCGKNLSDASRPFIFTFNENKIGVYACTEHEFSIATDKEYGSNPYDPLESFDHVKDLSARCDYVIVLYHGGKEHYRYPSPLLQKKCRKFIEKGANIVVCQHSHCIGCMEDYLTGSIIYGQGNFLFDGSNDECWNTGLLIEIKKDFSLNYIPLKRTQFKICIPNKEEGEIILNEFKKRSKQIKDEKFIIEEYNKLSNENITNYLLSTLCKYNSFIFRVINKLSNYKYGEYYLKHKFNKKNLLKLENMIECESINELLLNGIKQLCAENGEKNGKNKI